jgi:hypothetical protein
MPIPKSVPEQQFKFKRQYGNVGSQVYIYLYNVLIKGINDVQEDTSINGNGDVRSFN